MKASRLRLRVATFGILLVLTSFVSCTQSEEARYLFKPGTTTPYRIEVISKQSFQTGDRLQTTTFYMDAVLNFIVDSSGSQATTGITVVPSIVNVRLSKDEPRFTTGRDYGYKLHFLLDAQGKVRNYRIEGKLKERHKPLMELMEQTLRELFPVLPKRPLTQGEAWSNSFRVKRQTPPMGEVYLLTRARYSVDQIKESKLGKRKVHIAVITCKFDYTLGDKQGNKIAADFPSGSHVEMHGSGSGKGTIEFNLFSHRVEQAELETDITTLTKIIRGGETQEVEQTVHSTIKLRVGIE